MTVVDETPQDEEATSDKRADVCLRKEGDFHENVSPPRLLGARYSDFRVFFPGRKYDFLTDFGGKPTAKTARTFCRSCFYCFPAAAAAVSAPLDARSSRSRADAFPMCGVFFFFYTEINSTETNRREGPTGDDRASRKVNKINNRRSTLSGRVVKK